MDGSEGGRCGRPSAVPCDCNISHTGTGINKPDSSFNFIGAHDADGEIKKIPTATKAMEVLKVHNKCERRQKIKISGCVAYSIVDGDDNLLDFIEKGGICL